MIVHDGKWIMEGDFNTETQLKDTLELTMLVNKIGFLPLFKCSIEGFSVEEHTNPADWWTGTQGDPWDWRGVLAAEGQVAYGKLFQNKAGFVSREWYPYFASYRRDGYDFDSRYEDGLASRKAKNIMDLLAENGTMTSSDIKKGAGFGKEGDKGFEGVMSLLQMQTYITVRGFQKKLNKNGEKYGWPTGLFSQSEDLFPPEHVQSAYKISPAECRDRIISQIIKFFPEASYEAAGKVIR